MIEDVLLRYVGIPYKHRGRDQSGFDCLGLVLCIYRDAGVDTGYDDSEEYSEDWFKQDPELYLRGLLRHGEAATLPLKELDLVYFSILGTIRHAGVMVDSQRFIHVLERKSVMVSRLSGFWRSCFAGARRFVKWVPEQ